MQGDIIIFSERYRKKKHADLSIPGFVNNKFLLDSTKDHSGVMCYFSIFEEIFNKCVCSTDNQIAFLGDFNFNAIKNDSSFERYLNNFNLVKVLNDVTTSNHTQIDTIFLSSVRNYHTGT